MKFFLPLFFLISTGSLFSINTQIYSKGLASNEQLIAFLSLGNSKLSEDFIRDFVEIYRDEAETEGVNLDVAFVQMCLETGFLNYGGLVEPYQNNFCGLGAYNGIQGAVFSTPREGVRAHIQHLKAYATTDDLVKELIDPRFRFVKRGSVTEVKGLAGTWAEDPEYGYKLTELLKRLLYKIEDNILIAKNTNENIVDSLIPLEAPLENSKLIGWD